MMRSKRNNGHPESQAISRSIRCTAMTLAGPKCKNRTRRGNMCWVHLQKKKGLRVRKTKHGLGLFARKEIEAGEPITSYPGKMLTKKEVDEKYPGGITAQCVLCDDDKQSSLCLDAGETTSGYGRFANSPYGSGKDINAKFDVKVKMSQGKNKRKILGAKIVATKPLKKGDEILVDYGADYDFSH